MLSLFTISCIIYPLIVNDGIHAKAGQPLHEERKGSEMKAKLTESIRSKRGMELVQVAILVAIAVALGLIFKTQLTDFVNKTFQGLSNFA